jgi:hypothetical protein
MTSASKQPEFIQGRGQWKAGRGSVVTDWHETKEAAEAAYWAEQLNKENRNDDA